MNLRCDGQLSNVAFKCHLRPSGVVPAGDKTLSTLCAETLVRTSGTSGGAEAINTLDDLDPSQYNVITRSLNNNKNETATAAAASAKNAAAAAVTAAPTASTATAPAASAASAAAAGTSAAGAAAGAGSARGVQGGGDEPELPERYYGFDVFLSNITGIETVGRVQVDPGFLQLTPRLLSALEGKT